MQICFYCLRATAGQTVCPHCGKSPTLNVNPPPALAAGANLAGRYLLGRMLGEGGSGITYLAHQFSLGARVAIKEYFPGYLNLHRLQTGGLQVDTQDSRKAYEHGLSQFCEEARRIVQLNHPNIVRAVDFLQCNGTAYLVMEYCEGLSLEAYLRSHGGRADEETILRIIRPVFDGLQYVHEARLVHRDVKPENIHLTEMNQILLLDFGSARPLTSEGVKTKSLFVTPCYSAPELYHTSESQGPWSDVYSCGATLYRSLGGIAPPDALARCIARRDPLAPIRGLPGVALSSSVAAAVMRAMELAPPRRFQSIRELREAVLNGGRNPVTPAVSPSRIKEKELNKTALPRQRANWPMLSILALLILLFCGCVALILIGLG